MSFRPRRGGRNTPRFLDASFHANYDTALLEDDVKWFRRTIAVRYTHPREFENLKNRPNRRGFLLHSSEKPPPLGGGEQAERRVEEKEKKLWAGAVL
jgi:hypothetical protein